MEEIIVTKRKTTTAVKHCLCFQDATVYDMRLCLQHFFLLQQIYFKSSRISNNYLVNYTISNKLNESAKYVIMITKKIPAIDFLFASKLSTLKFLFTFVLIMMLT